MFLAVYLLVGESFTVSASLYEAGRTRRATASELGFAVLHFKVRECAVALKQDFPPRAESIIMEKLWFRALLIATVLQCNHLNYNTKNTGRSL